MKIKLMLAMVSVLFVAVALCGGRASAETLRKTTDDKGWAEESEPAPWDEAKASPAAELEPRPRPVLEAVKRLQPWYARECNERDARRVAGIIRGAAEANSIDPLLATAIAMRESSLRAGRVVGALGEEGMFQVMPRGYARRVCPRDCDVSQPHCNAAVALCYLAHCRELCATDDTWVWVGAYGTDHCPTAREARSMASVHRARAYLVTAVGEERAAAIWPL